MFRGSYSMDLMLRESMFRGLNVPPRAHMSRTTGPGVRERFSIFRFAHQLQCVRSKHDLQVGFLRNLHCGYDGTGKGRCIHGI